jgi:hypothetical protein
VKAVELQSAGDPHDAGLVFSGGEVTGFLGGMGTGAVGSVADVGVWVADLE